MSDVLIPFTIGLFAYFACGLYLANHQLIGAAQLAAIGTGMCAWAWWNYHR